MIALHRVRYVCWGSVPSLFTSHTYLSLSVWLHFSFVLVSSFCFVVFCSVLLCFVLFFCWTLIFFFWYYGCHREFSVHRAREALCESSFLNVIANSSACSVL